MPSPEERAPQPAERALWEGGPALRNRWPSLGAAAACLASAAPLYVWGLGWLCAAGPAAGAALALCALLRGRAVRFAVTSQRVIRVSGLLGRRRSELELRDIRNVGLRQSLGQRLIGLGDIAIEAAGGEEFLLAGIARPLEVLELIRQARLASAVPAQN